MAKNERFIKPRNASKYSSMYRHGMKVHHFTLLRRLPPRKVRSANLKYRWRVECVCGDVADLPEYYLRRSPNPKTHCGCLSRSIKVERKGEYGIYMMMHRRCYNDTHKFYKYYGGRGISVCARWNRYSEHGGVSIDVGFANFLEDMGPRPSKGHSIDRINVNGDYEPTNCRWATAAEQAANKR